MFLHQLHIIYSNIVLEKLISMICFIKFPKSINIKICQVRRRTSFRKFSVYGRKSWSRTLIEKQKFTVAQCSSLKQNINRANTANKNGGNICARPLCCYLTGNRSAVKPLVRFFWIHVSESESFICVTEVVTNVTWYTDNWNSDSLLFPEHWILHVLAKGISYKTFLDLNHNPERTIQAYPIFRCINPYKTAALERLCLVVGLFVSLIV